MSGMHGGDQWGGQTVALVCNLYTTVGWLMFYNVSTLLPLDLYSTSHLFKDRSSAYSFDKPTTRNATRTATYDVDPSYVGEVIQQFMS